MASRTCSDIREPEGTVAGETQADFLMIDVRLLRNYEHTAALTRKARSGLSKLASTRHLTRVEAALASSAAPMTVASLPSSAATTWQFEY
jgi:hypothetical protein